MILKFESDEDEIYFIEATGGCGVALNTWSKIKPHIGSSAFYDKVIFRHVNFSRNDNMVNKLETFLEESIG